eukprot:94764_1
MINGKKQIIKKKKKNESKYADYDFIIPPQLRNVPCCCIYFQILAEYEKCFIMGKICYKKSIKNAIDPHLNLTDDIMDIIYLCLGKQCNNYKKYQLQTLFVSSDEIKQQQDYLDSDDFISVCNKMRNI